MSDGESGTGIESGGRSGGCVVSGTVVEMELIADWMWEDTSELRLEAEQTDRKTWTRQLEFDWDDMMMEVMMMERRMKWWRVMWRW